MPLCAVKARHYLHTLINCNSFLILLYIYIYSHYIVAGLGSILYPFATCHGMTSFLSFSHLCLSPAPSPSPSNSIRPHPPAFCCLHSNSEVYSCNYATSTLELSSA